MTLQDCLFSENTSYGIDIKWTDNVEIKDSIVKGYTPETKILVKPPYFNEPCVTSHLTPPTYFATTLKYIFF